MIVSTMWNTLNKLGFQTLSMFNGVAKLIHKFSILPLTGYLTVSSTQPHLMSYLSDIISKYKRTNLSTDVGLIFGLPTEGRILQVTSTSSDHPFGTIRACEEKLLDLPVGEEFRRAFIYYACATLLAPTSRLNGCRNFLCLTNWLRELGDTNNLRPLGYMAAFYFYRKYGINIMIRNEQSTNINGHSAQ
ncbi:hypothetical protein AAG906_022215 [Vitis piasezkii]